MFIAGMVCGFALCLVVCLIVGGPPQEQRVDPL